MKLLSRNEEIVLLAIWRLEDNAYGVTIRDLVSEITGQDWTFGAIYVPLDKLTRKGFVTKTLSEPTSKRGGRSKCMYELSSTGKRALKEIRQVQEALWKNIPRMAFD
jgi:PadR family transcriptional regulator PadR